MSQPRGFWCKAALGGPSPLHPLVQHACSWFQVTAGKPQVQPEHYLHQASAAAQVDHRQQPLTVARCPCQQQPVAATRTNHQQRPLAASRRSAEQQLRCQSGRGGGASQVRAALTLQAQDRPCHPRAQHPSRCCPAWFCVGHLPPAGCLPVPQSPLHRSSKSGAGQSRSSHPAGRGQSHQSAPIMLEFFLARFCQRGQKKEGEMLTLCFLVSFSAGPSLLLTD